MSAIVFDLDGTLVDHQAASGPAVRAWAAELGISGEKIVERWRAISSRHYARYQSREISFQEQRRARVRDFLGRPFDPDEADRLFDGYLRRYEAGWAIYPDTVACLQRARAAGLSIGLLTNGERAQQLRKVDRFGLAGHFDVIVCSSELPQGKPDPSAFAATVRALDSAPEETLMIGDDLVNDVRGAIDAGLSAVLLDRERTVAAPGIRAVASLDELTFVR